MIALEKRPTARDLFERSADQLTGTDYAPQATLPISDVRHSILILNSRPFIVVQTSQIVLKIWLKVSIGSWQYGFNH